jgi:TnpA family transposase
MLIRQVGKIEHAANVALEAARAQSAKRATELIRTLLPSDILRRMNSRSRKNRLYFAFRELGRVVRTLFLLQYISDLVSCHRNK